jgi:hypothetical protein
MPRDGSGNFTLPANTQAVSGDPISSTKFNTLVQDLEQDANTDRPIVAGGTGASTALAARANLGLEIGVNVQAYDAGLLSIAGLTTLADRSIYTTASDTYAVYTLTAAGRAILDDADAAAQRTTLGLGTAATVNTGTSGATIPLLDAANTFGTTQVISLTNAGGSAQGLRVANTSGAASSSATISLDPGNNGFGDRDVLLRATNNGSNQITFSILQANAGAPGTTLSITSAGVATMLGNTMWHAGNDGAGSGLDADTLDGVEGSAYAALAGSQTFTGAKTFTAEPAVDFAPNTDSGITFRNSTSLRWRLTGATGAESGSNVGSNLTLYRYDDSGTFVGDVLSINRATGAIRATQSFAGRTTASTETTGTLTVASANTTIQATGDITIPNAVFAAGDIILIYAGASARTITEGSSVTMRLGGTATTGSRTLAARGVAVLFFVSSSEVVVSGGAVT